MDALSTRMQESQRKLRTAVADAERAGHKIRDDGWVEAVETIDPKFHNDPDYQGIQQRANAGLGGFRARIDAAVTEASTVCTQAAELLYQIDPFDLDKRYGADRRHQRAQWLLGRRRPEPGESGPHQRGQDARERRHGLMLWATPRRSAAASALTLLLGGCMSDKKEANAPLPRMSKENAEEWAKHWTGSMTRTAKAALDPKTAKPTADYSNCIGKNGESADDGRFALH
ncbi:hypothetical protein ACFWBX_32655 [Streptomyces sp. NPDC059991]|uniref:hypothetical protein n=1 Tax=Streptomyces sp. NPDC059991 TaxID=3347028 RepID=UPI00367C78B4